MVTEKKVAFATHSPTIPTGFGRVSKEVSRYLGSFSKEIVEKYNAGNHYYRFFCIGWQYQGEPIQFKFMDQKEPEPYMFCPTAPGGNYNEFGQRTFPQFLPFAQPDCLITLADWFVFAPGAHNGYINYNDNWLPRLLSDAAKSPQQGGIGKKVHNVWYFPIDSTPINKAFVKLLEMTEVPIVMSRYGSKELRRLGIRHEYIPHGVHPHEFKPNTEEIRMTSRRNIAGRFMTNPQFTPHLKDIENKFIVGWLGRNQLRKNPQLLVEVCGKFAEDKDDVLFIFHSTPLPYQLGVQLPQHLERYDITNKVMFTEASQVYYPSSQYVNNIINTWDVMLDVAGGEGFGFIRVEAAAAGVARVLVNWTTSAELMGLPDEDIPIRIEDAYSVTRGGNLDTIRTEYGFLIPVMERYTSGAAADFSLVDTEKTVEALNYLYDHRGETKKMGQAGSKFAHENYAWNKVLPKWREVLEAMFADEEKLKVKMKQKQKLLEQVKAQSG